MVKSQKHGKSSSVLLPAREACRRLSALCDSPPLYPVISGLSPVTILYLVGGTVRDVLSGIEETDFDLASPLHPAEVAAHLEASGIKVVETGMRHGTVTAVIGSEHIEITTFRKPGKDAQCFSLSIQEDLGARDFTINAIAFDIRKHTLIDPYGGVEDLRLGLVRAVGMAAERFSEDALRILRLLRFGPASGRSIDAMTLDAARTYASQLALVSPERVREELLHLLNSAHPAEALRMLPQLGIMGIILPELVPCVGFDQNRFHTQDVFEHTLSVIERCPAEGLLRFAALFHDAGKPHTLSTDENGDRHFYEHEVVSARICKAAMRRLRFSHAQIREVVTLVGYHMRPVECGPAGVRRLMRDLGPYFDSWRIFKYADATPTMADTDVREKLLQFDKLVLQEVERQKKSERHGLAVTGHDLLRLGFQPGPQMGEVLRQLEELVIEQPELNTKQQLLKIVTEADGKPVSFRRAGSS